MGADMTERLVLGGHRLISFDRSPEAIQRVVDKGALGAHSLGGEGRWTVEEAIERNVPVPVLMLSLFARFASRQADSSRQKSSRRGETSSAVTRSEKSSGSWPAIAIRMNI